MNEYNLNELDWGTEAVNNLFLELENIVDNGSRAILDRQLMEALEPALIDDNGSYNHWDFLKQRKKGTGKEKLLDFGCGTGLHRARVEKMGYEWHGIDIADSQESLSRNDKLEVILYDGLKMPINDQTFDVVLSTQTFEHVQEINLTFSEISRIMKKNGQLLGSTSQSELYHSRSTFNYSPYGFKILVEKFGMRLEKIHPGIDGFTLGVRTLLRHLGYRKPVIMANKMFHDQAPLNKKLAEIGKRKGYKENEINCLKLQFCGQFRFNVVKL
jgi:SAM-dependent methyltransferase